MLLFGFVYHPYIAVPTDEVALAEAAAADPTRWGLSHLAIGVGYAFAAVAFIALRSYLRDVDEHRWSRPALPFAVLGSALFPILTGMEFALLAAVETGGDAAAAQDSLLPWFIPILIVGAVSFALGAVGFALAIARSGILGQGPTWLVIGGLVVASLARFVPLGASQIVIGVALALALWTLALQMWRNPEPSPDVRATA